MTKTVIRGMGSAQPGAGVAGSSPPGQKPEPTGEHRTPWKPAGRRYTGLYLGDNLLWHLGSGAGPGDDGDGDDDEGLAAARAHAPLDCQSILFSFSPNLSLSLHPRLRLDLRASRSFQGSPACSPA
jgi:hypothetical protein